eukprot:TRINITY_DN41492_c0_g1_i1.p1 TRINITY_DN41492_c0_g1~~TRINITY_DN41492_c0_g1_i1.p1  ORF type:complete len:157 (-),score=28.24 TRINITY_DN41492_c0_g1_i1:10-423(-)
MTSSITSRALIAGYSLVEAMIVVAVMAVVLSMAIPSYSAMSARTRLRTAADHLRSDLSEARTQALQRGQPVYVSFWRSANGEQWCWALSSQAGCDCMQKDTGSNRYCYLDVDRARIPEIGRAVQQECRDRSRMPSSA